ncbi:MAG: tetratricopeptide repeat protein [Brevundimonas sp.]
MSRSPVNAATTLVAAVAILAAPGVAQAQAQDPAQPQASGVVPRVAPAPASPERRAEMQRADALTRSVFWRGELETNPADVEAALNLSDALIALGQPEQAAAVADAALLALPNHRDLLLMAGRAHIARGQAFYGVASLERARDLEPSDWRAWSLLGVAYQQVRRSADAEAAWAQGLLLAPDNPTLLANVAMARLTAGNPAEAEALLRRAVAQPGASLKVSQNLALVLGLQGKTGEAEQLLRRNLPPEQADANLAWLRAQTGATGPQRPRTWDSLQGG